MTTRQGGVSAAPYDTMNPRPGIGDAPEAVAENRARLQRALGLRSVPLSQVHGTVVFEIDAASAAAPMPEADASVCVSPGFACEVQAADCLPVLFADVQGRGVAAAHAGWRGLAGGVIEAALAKLVERSGARPEDIEAWLGPCIGPRSFEVGPDVLGAFGAALDAPGDRFVAGAVSGKWFADLPGLARDRLERAGVRRIDGGRWCTFEDASRFFSFRRDGRCGRLAACIGLAR
ncbi:MAG TPA: peptidoglycan editing factor PgeF [Methylibium sp.]|uniref:peptidoglycan editing factor PgeF n=1 Tax=Methylibium sp. TaxID=2067992 RepID=UPI002DB9FD29|nr:peptidoglycan editing factor PgeF [Methylibium sp.]HEU4460603.1 peptidoglycan editing factor PgeF [Methylibium sp.]